MRRFLLVLMLLSLPLRGLVGDAMAYGMLPAMLHEANADSENNSKSIANYLISASENIVKNDVFQSEKTSQSPCHDAMTDSDNINSESSQCTTCQVCHLTAFLPLSTGLMLAQTGVNSPSQTSLLWRSAEPRRITKTPVL